MGRYDSYDDEDDLEQGNDNSNPMRELRRLAKARENEIKELKAQLEQAQKGMRERSLKDVVSAKGLNPKIAGLVPSDLTDEESISKWLDDYADVFGLQVGEQSPTGTVDQSDAASIQAMDRTMAGGQSPAGSEAMLERIKTMPFEELERLISGAGQ